MRACDGGACAGSDAGGSGRPTTCVGNTPCGRGDVCFKDQCVREVDVERFICSTPDMTKTPEVHFQMHVAEFVSLKPPKNMMVAACNINDVNCSSPNATFVDKDGNGDIKLDLPFGFGGFIEVRGDDVLTALWYFTEPLIAPRVAKDLLVPSPGTLQLLSSITAGKEPDPEKGLVILEAFDCTGIAIGGVSFEESKAGAIPFYIVDGTPNVEAKLTSFNEQDGVAAGGFFGATPGFTVFTARLGEDGPRLGEYNAFVRANAVTYLDIHP